ncbi:MAG: glycosyl hydrolase family 95 catalytic domain-containing protein [Chitinophagales bacterium]
MPQKSIRLLILFMLCKGIICAQTPSPHDLSFDSLATRWDEAIPLGNGMLGSLIWQKGERLRFSLDRADLWDMRPMRGLHRKEFSYQWVYGQVIKKDYDIVQQYFDAPYLNDPAPSKIPGAALEFDTRAWGPVQDVHLFIQNALCEVKWANAVVLKTFVDAKKPIGWFRFENLPDDLVPVLMAPKYQGAIDSNARGNVEGDDLTLLGYQQGAVKKSGTHIYYIQKGWGGFTYRVDVYWKKINAGTTEGVWTISSHFENKKLNTAGIDPLPELQKGYAADYGSHKKWWADFWSKSALHVPDTVLEKQWFLEQYKFGSAARRGAPPISLQAVWTADNGRMPPWKGDFHHDLNTELSYWPCYSGNHLEEGLSYLDHLDKNKANYKRFTKRYFNKEGLAVPGVTTLDGTEMGGWIQYSLSPTTSAWLAQHFYLQWKYSMDRTFLKNRAYPWIRDVAVFLENMTALDEHGKRKLPMSSSPEINNNSLSAWFMQNTNYDLALMKFTFRAAGELALELGLKEQAAHWNKIESQFGDYALTDQDELMFAPSKPYDESHRHFSNLLAIYPLGLLQWEHNDKERSIIKNSLALVDKVGSANWCGYSFAWLASLKARAKDGEGAATALKIFAKAFCSVNSFHLNGDQTGSGYSTFTYRPFTLEGNFAFASGLQEMLLQSYAGFIEVMPAVPDSWRDISFEKLRAEGAFLVSARKSGGQITGIQIRAEKGGITRLKLPFAAWKISLQKDITAKDNGDGYLTLVCKPGGTIAINNLNK